MTEQSNKSEKSVHYDDELDEDFEEELANELSLPDMKKTIQSFEKPKSLDEIEAPSPFNLEGKHLDEPNLSALLEQLKKMPKEDINSLLKNLKQEKEYDNTKHDFSSVSEDHKEDAKARLKNKLKAMSNGRKTKK